MTVVEHPLAGTPTPQEQQQQQQQPTPTSTTISHPTQHELDDHTFHHLTEHPAHRTVVIALDQSHNSDYAFHWALKLFLMKERDLVVLVTVRPVATVPGPYAGPMPFPVVPEVNRVKRREGTTFIDFGDYVAELEEQYRIKARALIQSYALELVKNGFSVKGIVMRGDPRDEIIRKVKELNADALVMGSRGLGALKRTFLGSVSDYCVHHSPCPVVIVREPKDAHKEVKEVKGKEEGVKEGNEEERERLLNQMESLRVEHKA